MGPAPAARMDPRFCVRVEVPVLKDGRDGGGTWCASGTGYPVGRDLILTARHVAVPPGRDERYPIRIHWTAFPDFADGGRVALAPDALVRVGPGEHDDVALLRCPARPPGVLVPAWPWARGAPPNGARFESQGYPAATQFDDPAAGRPRPSQNAFSGTIRCTAEPWFEIVDTAAPKTAEDWQGASGMAIFTDQGIVGVFNAALRDMHGKGIAVPIAPLLKPDSQFARYFTDESFEKHWQAVHKNARAEVARRLERCPLLTRAVLDTFDRSAAGDAIPAAVDLLLDMDFETFAGVAGTVYDVLRDGLDGAAPAEEECAVAPLRQVVLSLAPLRYDEALVRRAYASALSAELLELPVALYAVAELVLAAQEGRSAAYQDRSGPNDDDVRGANCLSAMAPELGIEASAEAYCDRLEVHLGRKGEIREASSPERFLDDFEAFLNSAVYSSGRVDWGATSAERARNRRVGIDRKLAKWHNTKNRKVRPYTVFRPQGTADEPELREIALELQRRFPSLRTLFLTAHCNPDQTAPHPWDLEVDRTTDFVHVLRVRQSAPETPKP